MEESESACESPGQQTPASLARSRSRQASGDPVVQETVSRPQEHARELSMYSMAMLGALVGVAAGLLVKAFKIVLELSMDLLWEIIPGALAEAGWRQQAGFGLCNYTWLLGAVLGATVGALRGYLLDEAPAPSLGPWIKALHSSGCAPPGRWLCSLVMLGYLTVLSGAAVGPEPIVIIVPSVIAGAFTRGPLGQPPVIVRVLALAGGAAGLSAMFGLPIASAFMVLEVPSIDGAQFAMEALPACLIASVTGAVFGDAIWHPGELLGNSRLWFPGGDLTNSRANHPFGMMPILFGIPVGLLAGGVTTHCLIALMKSFHPVFACLKGGRGGRRSWWRSALVLGAVGAINGAACMVYPSAQFWGEFQLQVALTRGCAHSESDSSCDPFELPYWSPLLTSSVTVQATPGHPMSAASMLGLGGAKMLMIALGEASGFVGGAIYPVIFMAASFGSALGALPAIQTLGGQFVYMSTAGAMSVALAALLNTNLFAILLVVVLQANIPQGNVSSQIIALSCAVFVHYGVSRKLITPYLHMIVSQKARSDISYIELFVAEAQPSTPRGGGSSAESETSGSSDGECVEDGNSGLGCS